MTSTVHAPDAKRDGIDPSRVRLRSLNVGDAPCIRRWMADPDVIRFTVLVPGPEYAPVKPYPPDAADHYLRTLMLDPKRRSFAVLVDERHVGNVGLKEVDLHARHAECFIEVGERDVRGAGVGREAMRQLLEHAFDEMALCEVTLGVFEFNMPARRLYQGLAFDYVGTYGWHFTDGRYWHVLQMTLKRDEWEAQRACF